MRRTIALENPESTYSTGQSTTLAPDLVEKIAYEPGWGHFELKALGRLFRDRIAATETTNTGRHALLSPTGTAAGYGSPLVSYASCTYEVALNGCHGDNRNIYEGTIGYWYRLYRVGESGRIEYGNQVMYVHRSLWSGIGNTPDGAISRSTPRSASIFEDLIPMPLHRGVTSRPNAESV